MSTDTVVSLENLESSKEYSGSGEPVVQMLLPEGPSEKRVFGGLTMEQGRKKEVK